MLKKILGSECSNFHFRGSKQNKNKKFIVAPPMLQYDSYLLKFISDIGKLTRSLGVTPPQ